VREREKEPGEGTLAEGWGGPPHIPTGKTTEEDYTLGGGGETAA